MFEDTKPLKNIGSPEDPDGTFDQARTSCMAAGNAARPVVLEEECSPR